MRAEFASAMLALRKERENLVFITGDVGYMALEAIELAFGARFINAGVAEQNCISLAAGLAREGQLPWVYGTAAFTALRPYEQIRDDVCLHRMPVKLVGNGGGYGFGIMGATHHALEDVGCMRALPHMRVYVPLVASDVAEAVFQMAEDPLPNYLRLNAAAAIPGVPRPFAPWRRLRRGGSAVIVGLGPVLQRVYDACTPELLAELEIWSVGSLPLAELPSELVASIRATRRVITIEEHYRACGLGEALSYSMLATGAVPDTLECLTALGYPSARYGSQRWHQDESGLGGPTLAARLQQVLRA